jgi:hypothetical protein
MRSTQRNAATSSLLKLPGELRNRIYEILHNDAIFYLQHPTANTPESLAMAPSTHLSLLRTCRQINSEAKYLPLALGTLSVDHLSTLGMLILRRILCEGQRHTVSSLTFVLRPYVRVLDLAYDRNADHYIRPSTQYLIDKWTSALSTFSGLLMLPEARKLYIQLDK